MADNKLMTEVQTAELIGKTIKNLEIDVDLSEYSTTSDIDEKISEAVKNKVDQDTYTQKIQEIDEKIQTKADASDLNKLETDLTNKLSAVYRYKGSVTSYDQLPTDESPEIGDVYDVANGMNYAWNGSTWDALGDSRIEVDAMLNQESTNPVQNKVIYEELQNKAGKSTASSTEAGLMSSDDKNKLDDIAVATQQDIDSVYTSAIAPYLTITASAK